MMKSDQQSLGRERRLPKTHGLSVPISFTLSSVRTVLQVKGCCTEMKQITNNNKNSPAVIIDQLQPQRLPFSNKAQKEHGFYLKALV